MAFNFGAIVQGIDAALPVFQKAQAVFAKKPKAVQQEIIERLADPGPAPAGPALGIPLIPILVLAAIFLLRRK